MIQLFLVTIDIPDGATIKETEEYIKEAVTCWSGNRDTEEDPLFFLDRKSIKVRRVRQEDKLI